VLGAEPLPRRDEAGQRLRQLRQQRLPRRHGQIVAGEQIFADRRQVAETRDNAVDGKQRDVGVGIFQERQAGLGRADFGDGGGERQRQHRPVGDLGLHVRLAGGDQVHEIVLQQQRRARQDRLRDVELVGGERMHHHARRLLRGGEHVGERSAHQRRGIVEQHDHRAFGGGAIVGRQIGMEISPRQRGRGLGAFAGRRITDPLQELTDNHDSTDATKRPSHNDGRQQA
jgi:hypothetical protein